MVLALAIVGLLLLGFSARAWRRNRLSLTSEMPPLWRRLWRWRWAIGGTLGVASYFLRYPVEGGTDHYMVYGIPFMSYAFDQNGRDYVGPLTMPALVLNFVTWALLPQVMFWLWGRLGHGRRGSAGA